MVRPYFSCGVEKYGVGLDNVRHNYIHVGKTEPCISSSDIFVTTIAKKYSPMHFGKSVGTQLRTATLKNKVDDDLSLPRFPFVSP